MSRIARIVLPDVPYHITQRGNARQQVFFHDRDYTLYLDLLRQFHADAHLRILAYCLMPNHIHLIAIPERPNAMADALRATHANYARHYNLEKRSCGHVWQARYFSTPMDTTHLWRAMAYVERNPVRAGLVQYAEHFSWSSARLRLTSDPAASASFIDLAYWRAEYSRDRWKQALQTSVDEEAFGQRLQEASRHGRPLGNDEFVRQLERRSGRTLRPSPVGRPKKQE